MFFLNRCVPMDDVLLAEWGGEGLTFICKICAFNHAGQYNIDDALAR